MLLGDVIYSYRFSHGKMSMKQFAEKANLSVAYVNQLENNRNPKTNEPIVPSLETFSKVASAMGITLDALLSQVDENQPVGLDGIRSYEQSIDNKICLTDSERLLIEDYRQLNPEGQEKVREYTCDLVSSGRYIKSHKSKMVE